MIARAQTVADPSGVIATAYSKKLNMQAWETDLIADITSSDYFGEAKGGDTVQIPVEPTVTVSAFVEGAPNPMDRLVPSTQEIVIDQAWKWNTGVGLGTKTFSYLNLLDIYGKGGMKSASKYVHEQFFSWLAGKANSQNRGANAGKESGGAASKGYNLGTSASPVPVKASTFIAHLLKFVSVLGEQNLRDETVAIILPEQLYWLYLQTELRDASISGDDKSKLVTGYMGTLDGRVKFYRSNYVTGSGTSGDPFCVFAMTKQAVAYTNRLTLTRLWEYDNADVSSQGFGIWGRGIIKDWALCEGWFYIADAEAPWAA